jgi:acetyl-CoA carboxylase carboxyltransferase component
VITGTAAGGGCYSPALTDFVIMTRQASMFLTGPAVVREVLHEEVTPEALGGAKVHERNGVCHLVAKDDLEAIDLARELVLYLPPHGRSGIEVGPADQPDAGDPAECVPVESRRVYDMREVIRRIVDGGRMLELRGAWARNLVTALARMAGRPVGVIANQPKRLGGVLDVGASMKGASFVELCDRHRLPLVVLVDTPGFMPGPRQEGAGVIRHGAHLVHAFAAARVPRVTVVLRKAYGGAYIAMNSKSLGASRYLAWLGAEIGIMGPRPAAQILHRRHLRGPGKHRRLARLAKAYAVNQLSAQVALERGLIDAVIEPAATRRHIIAALVAGNGSRATDAESRPESPRGRERSGLGARAPGSAAADRARAR